MTKRVRYAWKKNGGGKGGHESGQCHVEGRENAQVYGTRWWASRKVENRGKRLDRAIPFFCRCAATSRSQRGVVEGD